MEILALAALAGVLGFVYTFVTAHISQYVPNNQVLNSTVGKSVVTGAFILVSFLAATYALRALHLSKHLPKAVK
jgi:hypothetical protein